MKRALMLAVAAALVLSGGQTALAVEKGKAPAAGTKVKVEECFTKKDSLKGKKVTVSGKAVKVNMAIMGKNWVHIQDGSGKQGTNDITVTTNDTVTVGDKVTATGTLVVDKDFGGGYTYAVIIEDASVKAEK